jgi:hypothetical protein
MMIRATETIYACQESSCETPGNKSSEAQSETAKSCRFKWISQRVYIFIFSKGDSRILDFSTGKMPHSPDNQTGAGTVN